MKKKALVLVLLLCAMLIISSLPYVAAENVGTTYYVSPSGNDENDGTSLESAWKTIGKVNGISLKEGDRVLFEAGRTFNGTLEIGSDDGGSKANPVIIGSYGIGRALIYGGAGNGISLKDTHWVVVNNINVKGAGRKEGNQGGRGVNVDNSSDIIINQVDATGFQWAGVAYSAANNLRITNVFAHHNGFGGISSYRGALSNNVYIGYCRTVNNPGDPIGTPRDMSGQGIVVDRTNNAVVEYCESAINGWDMLNENGENGPVGIWTLRSDNVLFQYNISHSNRTLEGKSDGGGFDFDSGTNNSIMQYNYSYNNMASGYMLCAYSNDDPTHALRNNILRYNISVNDASNSVYYYPHGGIQLYSRQLYDSVIHNNIVIARKDRYNVRIMNSPNNILFANNIFIGNGTGHVDGAVGPTDKTIFLNNLYWRLDGERFGTDGCETLEEWQDRGGFEILNGERVGIHANPKVLNMKTLDRMTDPRKLKDLWSFKLMPDSPAINKALDLKNIFDIDMGRTDFYGNEIPQNGSYDIGIYEYDGSEIASAMQIPLPFILLSAENLVKNAEFNSSNLDEWILEGSPATEASEILDIGGVAAALRNVGDGISQKIEGLKENTVYRFQAYGKLESTNEEAYFYVKDYGRSEKRSYITATGTETQINAIVFKTGPNQDSAVIGMRKTAGAGMAYGDFFEVIPAEEGEEVTRSLVNGNFENGNTDGWFTYESAVVEKGSAYEGDYAMKVTGSGNGFYQTLSGLKPNTEYTVKAFGKLSDSNQTGYFFVKDFGGEEQRIDITSTSYAESTLTFTTNAESTTAVIGMWRDTGTETGDIYADSFQLISDGDAGDIEASASTGKDNNPTLYIVGVLVLAVLAAVLIMKKKASSN